MEDDGDLQTLLSEQRRELAEALAVESDLDTAYQLQLQEAMNASLSMNPAVSSIPTPPTNSDSENVIVSGLLAQELAYYEQQFLDHKEATAAMKKIQSDLNRSIHDHAFARELMNVPEREWKNIGDNIEKPFGVESHYGRGVSVSHEDSFRVHVKGLIKAEVDGFSNNVIFLAGIGVAICDMNDELVLEVSKGVHNIGGETSIEVVEAKAVIEGINVAIMLGIKRIEIVSCSQFTYECDLVTRTLIGVGERVEGLFYFCGVPVVRALAVDSEKSMELWHRRLGHPSEKATKKNRPKAKDSNLANLFDQISVNSRKLDRCGAELVPENHLKFAVQLAHVALLSQARRQDLSMDNGKSIVETCAICLENISIDHMFQIDGCLHRFCFSCMRTYVQVKLIQSKMPKCPNEGCKSELKLDDCKTFLSRELFDTLHQRIMEASIDPAEKIYCPYPACSALMSKSEIPCGSGGYQVSATTCTKCHRRFCINCKVPWHDNMTCHTYKQQNPPPLEDSKFKSLATKSRWQQCPKCSHMVSLGKGCNHIYCRCGNEFCYKCGVEWKNKKATCGCPLWDERNIIYNRR